MRSVKAWCGGLRSIRVRTHGQEYAFPMGAASGKGFGENCNQLAITLFFSTIVSLMVASLNPSSAGSTKTGMPAQLAQDSETGMQCCCPQCIVLSF